MAGGVDWRSKLDIQRGAVLATELKNNSCKLAKWTASALLAGSDTLKFGSVTLLALVAVMLIRCINIFRNRCTYGANDAI